MASELSWRRERGRRRLQALLVVAAIHAGSAGRAQAAAGDEAPVYELRLGVDAPLFAAAALTGSVWLLRSELTPAWCAPRCDAAQLPAFDRAAAGSFSPGARTASDIGVAALLGGSASLLLLEGGFVDFGVGVQALLATSGLTVLTMMAVRRPRPFTYGEEAPLAARSDGNAALSFPSGHTAHAFAATLTLFHALHARHPRSPWPWIVLGTGCSLATGVGVLRVLAGDHFPSDVVAGAAIGAAVGWFVPELHRIRPGLSLVPNAGGATLVQAF